MRSGVSRGTKGSGQVGLTSKWVGLAGGKNLQTPANPLLKIRLGGDRIIPQPVAARQSPIKGRQGPSVLNHYPPFHLGALEATKRPPKGLRGLP